MHQASVCWTWTLSTLGDGFDTVDQFLEALKLLKAADETINDVEDYERTVLRVLVKEPCHRLGKRLL